ncbi:hypothetical protein EDD21DRAFT_371460 [Dissophora ornata]|nr:hypothetical protein EDD21DRAFT_371460 [Dissophora ornata]
MDTIAILQQLDQECTSWANQHAHSCNLLASLINITRQREQTLVQWQQQEQQQQLKRHSSAHNNNKSKALLASSTLQLLIHQQTLEAESVIRQLYDTIQAFRKALQGMITLERQVEAAIRRMDISKLLDTTSHLTTSNPSTSSITHTAPAGLIQSSLSPSSPPFLSSSASAVSPKFASEPTLIDTAEISPLEVLDWVSRIRAMYAEELNVKQAQIHPSMTAQDRFETLVDLQRNWGLQKRIDFGLEQEIVERVKTYRRVREFSSRV